VDHGELDERLGRLEAAMAVVRQAARSAEAWAKARSTTHRRGWTANPFWPSARWTTSILYALLGGP